MNDHELDVLLATHVRGYNAPPAEPPLLEIRERMHAERRRRSNRRRGAAAIATAAVVMFAVSLTMTERASPRKPVAKSDRATVGNVQAAMADRAINAALRSAEVALAENPGDPYFAEHLARMKSNADYFRSLELRHARGTT